MRFVASIAMGILCAVITSPPTAAADPTPGHFVTVKTPSPPMRCVIGSDDSDRVGPNVVCQTAGFPQAPIEPPPAADWHGDPSVLHEDQAIVTALGQLSWRTANLGLAPPGQPDISLAEGSAYSFQGWAITVAGDGTTFTNDATRHGMSIATDYHVTTF